MFYVNFPLISIILCFVGVVICSLTKRKVARLVTLSIETIVLVLNLILTIELFKEGKYVNYSMGPFAAPFGNEIRFGPLEGLLASVFPFILICSLLGGDTHLKRDLNEEKINYFYVLLNLILVALISLIYTNDVFTGYVFLEISTLASIGITMIRNRGRNIVAAIRYMIFNLLGSGLFLIGITLLYDITGYLSMEQIRVSLTSLIASKGMNPLIIITFSLITLGLAIKSGLFPFHFWMADTYGSSTTTARCILSGLISKGYIILLIKMIYRALGIENVLMTKLLTVLFALGVLGMLVGSINAIKQKNINKMIAFSSCAQIGYIYMGIGLATPLALCASVFHILTHACTKPLLFIVATRLHEASGSAKFKDLKGAGYRDKLAGFGFLVGSLSMVGVPLFAGFISKYLFADSAISKDNLVFVIITLLALAISTILNAFYFIHTVVNLYKKDDKEVEVKKPTKDYKFVTSMVMLVIFNVILGVLPQMFIEVINKGISLLG